MTFLLPNKQITEDRVAQAAWDHITTLAVLALKEANTIRESIKKELLALDLRHRPLLPQELFLLLPSVEEELTSALIYRGLKAVTFPNWPHVESFEGLRNLDFRINFAGTLLYMHYSKGWKDFEVSLPIYTSISEVCDRAFFVLCKATE